MNHKNGRIDKERLKELWNDGKSVSEIANDMQVSHSAVSQMITKLGMKSKTERIQTGVQTSVAKRIFYDSDKLYREGIDMVFTAKRMLSRLEAIIELNADEIKNTDGENLSKSTALQQNQMIKAIYNFSVLLKTLISYEETLQSAHNYQILKKCVVNAIERADPETKERFLYELRQEELNSRHLFGGMQSRNDVGDNDDDTYG